MSREHRLGRSPAARDGIDYEAAARDDLVGRMIAAAPAARRCYDPAEELRLTLPGEQAALRFVSLVPGQRRTDSR